MPELGLAAILTWLTEAQAARVLFGVALVSQALLLLSAAVLRRRGTAKANKRLSSAQRLLDGVASTLSAEPVVPAPSQAPDPGKLTKEVEDAVKKATAPLADQLERAKQEVVAMRQELQEANKTAYNLAVYSIILGIIGLAVAMIPSVRDWLFR